MATQSQIDSFNSLKPKLGQRQAAVLSVIEEAGGRGATLREIADVLEVELNSVSGRVHELCRHRLVDGCGSRFNPSSGKRMTVWIRKRGQLQLI